MLSQHSPTRLLLASYERQSIIPAQGEHNQLIYIPLGVGVVIAPWNLPCGILVGMTSASIVAGNSIVLKPASTAAATGYQFIRILEEIGLPAGVVNFLTGSGSVVGDALVDNPQTRFVAFTG